MSGSAAETWYAIVDGNGNLASIGTVIASAAELTAAGYTAVQVASDPRGQVWNPTTRTFAAPPNPSVIPTLSFIKRFTPTEYAAVYASTDPNVGMFRLELEHAPNGMINLASTDVINGLQYLETTAKVIGTGRAAQIGTP